VRKLVELMKEEPGFDVNKPDGNGCTLLHAACLQEDRSAIIPLLLAHPGINVNLRDINGSTPFFYACCGYTSSVRQLLKDPRVRVNEPDNDGCAPL